MSVSLKASARQSSNKSTIKALRATGVIPAVVYGKGFDATSVSVDAAEVRKLLADGKRNQLIELEIEGVGTKTVFIKEIVRNALRRDVTHMDFLVVGAEDTVTYRVPVVLVGVPVGVKIGGGNLNLICRNLKVRCKAAQLVDKVEIDVSEIEKGSAYFVRDVAFPAGTILTPASQAVATVS